MERLAEHEAFLRAIFDAPDDDTPRLVYADFLEENGEPERAEFIRLLCEQARLLSLEPGDPGSERLKQLLPRRGELQSQLAERYPERFHRFLFYVRGFLSLTTLRLRPDELTDVPTLRAKAVVKHPEWFGAQMVELEPGRPLQAEQINALFSLPCFNRVVELRWGGHVDEELAGPPTEEAGTFALIDMNVEPVITNEGVIALARHRGARRIETLILTHNNLDNDAARAIVQSPHLIRLRRLELLEGNRLRGRTWQQLLEKYGENVVG